MARQISRIQKDASTTTVKIQGGQLFNSFDPSLLSLTFWTRGSYSGVPWNTLASLGSSAGKSWISSGSDPSAGTALNGLVPADFNGTTDDLGSASNITSLVTNTSGSLAVLFYARTAFADTGSTTWYDMPSLVSQTASSRIGLVFSDAGVRLGSFSGANFDSVAVACSTGAWHLAQAYWDATTLNVRIDSGSWVQITRVVSLASDTIACGHDPDTNMHHFDGLMMEHIISDQVLSHSDFDNIVSYVNSRYALSL